MARTVNFFDGAQSSTTPTVGNVVASNLVQYPDDSTYEASESGAPTEGNIYYNTTLDLIRYYNGTDWISIVDESSTQTIENKTLDGTDATGNNTITNDADDVSYDNSTSLMAATDAQAAIDELDLRVDDNKTEITNLETLSGSPGDVDHGTFTGSTIPDNSTTKAALQSLETSLETVSNALVFQGTWDAATNTPTLTSGVGTAGHFYVVSVAGSTNLDGITDWEVGDWPVFNGTAWEKVDNTDRVTSVNGQTGAVVLNLGDINDVTETSLAAGDILRYDGANWVNSKEVDVSGTASATQRVVVSSDTTANLNSLARKKGAIYFDDTTNDYKGDDGTSLISLGAGGGGNESGTLDNIGLEFTASSGALLIELKQLDGTTNPTGGDPVRIAFRENSLTTGGSTIVEAITATSINIPSGATLGAANGVEMDIYVYAINDSGTVELAVSSDLLDETEIQSTTIISTGSDDSGLYSNATTANVAIRLIGRATVNNATAGNYASNPQKESLRRLDNLDDPKYEEAIVSSTTTTVTANVFVDSGAEITLTPGTWDIGYHVGIFLDHVAGSPLAAGTVTITDASNTKVAGSESGVGIFLNSTFSLAYFSASNQTEIVVTDTTTYKLRHASRQNNTDSTVTVGNTSFLPGLTDPDNASRIWARKIIR